MKRLNRFISLSLSEVPARRACPLWLVRRCTRWSIRGGFTKDDRSLSMSGIRLSGGVGGARRSTLKEALCWLRVEEQLVAREVDGAVHPEDGADELG